MNRQIEKYVKSTNEGGGSMLGSPLVRKSKITDTASLYLVHTDPDKTLVGTVHIYKPILLLFEEIIGRIQPMF